jgi:hypothetical protein
MLFNSYTFLIFLTVVLGLYYSPMSWHAKKVMLIAASYLFYAAWNPPFVLILILSTFVDWNLARRIYRSESLAERKFLLVCSLSVNLGLLGFFKYGEFLLHNFTGVMKSAGIAYQAPEMDIILPVGISFYTFQTLSYTIDIYRRELKPWHSFTDYALFVTFFPQLVAGPIVRARDFLHQTIEPKVASAKHLAWGASLMIIGLFQKVVLADGLLAPVVEKVYDSTQIVSPLAASIGTQAFAGQIFCDFAGYSTVAIGVAMCLGFSFPDNFRFPYAAVGFSEFLAALAHIAFELAARLPLYQSTRKPRRVLQDISKPDPDDAARRIVARGKLGICGLGGAAWPVSRPRTAGGAPVRRMAGLENAGRPDIPCSGDLLSRVLRLDILSRTGFRQSLRDHSGRPVPAPSAAGLRDQYRGHHRGCPDGRFDERPLVLAKYHA